jgi:hypothetical protein
MSDALHDKPPRASIALDVSARGSGVFGSFRRATDPENETFALVAAVFESQTSSRATALSSRP